MGMTDWFKPSSTLGENTGENFDFQAAQKKNERNRALAQLLFQNGQNFQGQMVSGHYIAPTNTLAALAKVASIALGAKMLGDADETDTAIKREASSSIDREFENFLKKKNPDFQPEPTNVPGIASDQEKTDILKMFGPGEDAAPAATTTGAATPSITPVKKAAAKALRGPNVDYSKVPSNIDAKTPQQVISTPTPAVPAGQAMGGGTPLARPYMGGGQGFAAPAPQPVPTAPSAGGGRGMVNPQVVQPGQPAPVAPKPLVAAALQRKPVPTPAPATPAPVATQAQPTSAQDAFLAAARAGAGKQMDGSAIKPTPQAPEYIPTTQQEQLRAISRISQMGPEGQFLANHLYNQQFGKDGGEYDIKDGIMYNKRTGQAMRVKDDKDEWFYSDGVKINRRTGDVEIVKPDAKEVERGATAANSVDDMNEALARLNTVLGDESLLKNAKGDLGNAIAGKFGAATGMANSTTVARTKINDAVGAATSSIIAMARAAGMSASQMNSDADMKRMDQLAGEIRDNYGALDLPTLRGKLVQLQDMVKRKRELLARQAGGQAPTAAPAAPSSGGGLLSGRF